MQHLPNQSHNSGKSFTTPLYTALTACCSTPKGVLQLWHTVTTPLYTALTAYAAPPNQYHNSGTP
eukprot:2266585-Karenia_brevis.AAC.1